MGKRKLKHKKIKKKREKSRKSHSDTNDSSSEDEWVEKKVEIPSATNDSKLSRDSWMSELFPIPTTSRTKSARDADKESKNLKLQLDYSSRELNPYMKSGQGGLPDEISDVKLCTTTTGDHGVEWLHKSLRRCKERAKEEKRSLEDVAAEYWGSLDKLKSLIAEAESRQRATKSNEQNSSSKNDRKSKKFIRPAEENDRNRRNPSNVSDHRKYYHSKSWRKPSHSQNTEIEVNEFSDDDKPAAKELDINDRKGEVLTEEQINFLAADVLRAKMSGDDKLVKKLSIKLENARKFRKQASTSSTVMNTDNVVVLTQTNSRGFCAPVKGSNDSSFDDRKTKKKKFVTHLDGKRSRCIEEDEKYSLKEMFEKEKMTSARDQNKEFSKLMLKGTRGDDEDEDGSFVEQNKPRSSKSSIENAIEKHKKCERILDDCHLCIDSPNLDKHLIIETGTKSYISVPSYQSLMEGHCLIVPMYHTTCATLLDEDVWQEMKVFCKHLIKMFQERSMDCVFYETAIQFHRLPHMALSCIPVTFDMSNLTPLYFRKAILECEKEWAQNEKLVNLRNMDIKRSIPKELPYFAVNFNYEKGFAHVIEDEKKFPSNFAEEVIGGLMDVDHSIWRKRKEDSFETQCQKASDFKKWWIVYRWTHK